MRSVKIKLSADVTDVKTNMRDGSESVKGFGRDVDRTARKAGRDLDEITRHAKTLERQIHDTDRAMGALAVKFAATGDAGVLKSLSQQKAKLAELKNVRSLLPDPVAEGQKFGVDLVGSMTRVLSSSTASTAGLIASAAAIAGPTIGSSIAAALIGGAGIGGVIGGLALAARNPQVKAAGTVLAKDLLADLQDRADVFVKPALAGIRTVRAGFRQLGPDLDRIFAASAGFVDPLVQGGLKGVQALTHGIADAVEDADPVIDALGLGFDKIGQSIGKAFSTIAPDARTGALAINDMTNGVSRFVEVSAQAVHYLALIRGGTDGSGGLEGIDRQFDKARYWIEDSSQVSDVLHQLGVELDITGDGFRKGSAEGQAYRRMTLGTASAQDLQLLSARGVQEATDALAGSQDAVGQATGALSVRQQILNSNLHDGIAAAGGFAEALQLISGVAISREQAEINYQRAIDAVTAAVKENGHTLDVHTAKGQANREALVGVATAAQAKAQATYDAINATKGETTAEVAAASQLERGRRQLVKNYLQFDNNRERAEAYAASILQIPKSWSTQVTADTQAAFARLKALGFEVRQMPDGSFAISARTEAARRRLEDLGFKVKRLPNGSITVTAETAAARARLAEARALLAALDGRTATTYVVTRRITTGGDVHVSGGIGSGTQVKNARGGTYTPMAAGGIGQIYPASNPPLYRYAEPETGGEAFIPRLGDRARGRALVTAVASWYDMSVVQMRRGDVTAAAAGLVNVAPRDAVRQPAHSGSRLDTAEAYIAARDAVSALTASLRENGRAMSLNSTKGRENRTVLHASIRAAQAAAQAKYDETGSVRAANLEYDRHVRAIRAALAQQHVAATTRIGLVRRLAGHPAYDTADAPPRVPTNSSSTVAFARAQMGVEGALGQARSFFDASWGRPTFGTGTASGRDNLTQLLDFLDQAGAAAQARYTQTGSSRLANGLYARYVRQLRGLLADAGMSKREIDRLVGMYGRITLGNRDGGVYEHAQDGVLRQAHIAPGGPTRYAYAEPATGGELFAPKNGNLAKTRADVGWAVSNWWGGDVRWQPGRAAAAAPSPQGGSLTIRLVVQDGQIPGLVAVQVDQALGALADAQVYATAG